MRDYDTLTAAGIKAQFEKLRENEHKTDWKDLSFEYLFNRVVDEVKELREAFEEPEVNEAGFKAIRNEAADVANFAHMIILKCDQKMKGE